MSAALFLTFCMAVTATQALQPQARATTTTTMSMTSYTVIRETPTATTCTTCQSTLQSTCHNDCGCDDCGCSDSCSEPSIDDYNPQRRPYIWASDDGPNHECGFMINDFDSGASALFTDFLETDFIHEQSLDNSEWVPWIMSINDDSGSGYTSSQNVITNPLRHEWDWYGIGKNYGQPGLQLVARNDTDPGDADTTPEAMIMTNRNDILYGSFRAAFYVPDEIGIIIGLVHLNGSSSRPQEGAIDGMFYAPINDTNAFMVDGSVISDLATIGNFSAHQNAFNQRVLLDSAGSHELRFDYLPDRMDTYLDGHLLNSFGGRKPEHPGSIAIVLYAVRTGPAAAILTEEAVVTVTYAKLYFNTTDPESEVRRRWKDGHCSAWDVNDRVAMIPTEYWDKNVGETFFFSKPETYNEHSLEHTDIQWMSSASSPQHMSVVATVMLGMVISFAALLM